MKHIPLKFVFLATSLLFNIGHVSAHDASDELAAKGGLTDLNQVNCTDDNNGPPAKLFFQISGDTVGAPLVSIQVQKDTHAKNRTDPVSGDGVPSSAGTVTGGGGAYLMLVDKSGVGEAGYSITYHCLTANGIHTGTTITPIQDQ